MTKLVLLTFFLVSSTSTASLSADPDVVQRQVKIGTYEQLTFADRLAVSAAVLGNPARFERISFGNAYAVNWDDFSLGSLLEILRATENGTAAIASESGTGEFVVIMANGAGTPWAKMIACVQKVQEPKKEDLEKCSEYVREWMVAAGGNQIFVTTDSSLKIGKPLGKVVNWNAQLGVAGMQGVTPQ